MPLFFLGTREWRNRQTRTVQVRVPVMEWGFNSPLAHDETADPLRICGFCFSWLWLRCCLSPRWCSGRRMCRAGLLCAPVGCGPPAREARQPHFVRRRASKPARALRSLRRPPHPWGRAAPWAAARPRAVRAASLRLGASPRIPARPRHRPRAPQSGPATAHGHRGRSLRRPPHRRRCVAGVWLGASARSPARPRASKRSLSSVSHAIP